MKLAGIITESAYVGSIPMGGAVKDGLGAFAHPDGLVRLHRVVPKKKYTPTDQPPVVVEARDVCQIPTCYVEIKTMCYKGTGVCSENHRKLRDGEKIDSKESALP